MFALLSGPRPVNGTNYLNLNLWPTSVLNLKFKIQGTNNKEFCNAHIDYLEFPFLPVGFIISRNFYCS